MWDELQAAPRINLLHVVKLLVAARAEGSRGMFEADYADVV